MLSSLELTLCNTQGELFVLSAEKGYSTKMLYSLWGLSDSYACGLYTAHPMTIKALEDATMRRINVNLIDKKISKLKEVATDFFETMDWIDTYKNGMVNTGFHSDRSNLGEMIDITYKTRDFPLPRDLPEGYEWLAFTFSSQEQSFDDSDKLNEYLEFSEEILIQAYSNMKMQNHAWTQHSRSEIDFIEEHLPKNGSVLDIGCGTGRHSLELARRGYDVRGVDFSDSLIRYAASQIPNEIHNISYSCEDAKKMSFKRCFDAVLCLYDVIGSYPKEEDNLKILRKAYNSLTRDGTIIVSVMNMELTKIVAGKNIVNGIEASVGKLLKLKGSNTMQQTGNVFKGNCLLIDSSTGIVYRKEQFFSEDALPIEYVIRDRRYSINGIKALMDKAGFDVKMAYCVQAGKFDTQLDPSDRNAKEILIIAKKKKTFSAIRSKFKRLPSTWE